MDEFLRGLQELDGARVQGLAGLAIYAKAFYKGALQRSKEEGMAIGEAMEQEMKHMREFFFKVDQRYYSELKGRVPEPIKELVGWIGKYGGK